MIHPVLPPDIKLGHLMQAAVLVVTAAGGLVGGYLGLRADLDAQRGEYRVAIAGHEARLAATERLTEERRAEERQFEAEMRAALERVARALADLRAELVQKQDRR